LSFSKKISVGYLELCSTQKAYEARLEYSDITSWAKCLATDENHPGRVLPRKLYQTIDLAAMGMWAGFLELLTLFHNETRDDGSPEQTLTVVKAAYPKLYGSCKSAGEAVSIGQLYQKLTNVIPEEQENGIGEDMTSEGVYVISLLFWLFWAFQKPISSFDGIFAMILLEVTYRQTDLYTPTNDLEISKEQRFVRGLNEELNGKTIPCTQLLHSPYADEEQLRLYYRLYEAAGQSIDLGKRLEATAIGEKELYRLMEIEADTLEPLMTTLVPFLVIKQSLANEEALARELEDARRELAKHRAMEKPEIPVDVRLVESEGQMRAPCVWIQPCYLSHKMYFRIIGDARSAGVERHYFHSLKRSYSFR